MVGIILVIIAILLIIWVFIGWVIYACAIRRDPLEIPVGKAGLDNVAKSWAKYIDKHREMEAEARNLPHEDITLHTPDGLKLIAHVLEKEAPERIIICAHGYRANGYRDFAAVTKWLVANHCRVILLEQRCCGGSGGANVTFGAREQQDIVLWTRLIAQKYSDLPIFLYGISMGASTVLMASSAELPERVRGIIADCGYSSMKDELSYLSEHWFRVKAGLILPVLDLWCRICGGFKIREADAIPALKQTGMPVLFIHGENDGFVPVENTLRNAKACKSANKVVIIPNAPHGMSAMEDPERYREEVMKFIKSW